MTGSILLPDADTAYALAEQLTAEGLISMNKTARECYGGANVSTVCRHATSGIRRPDGSRLRLETIRIGGKLMTSRAAVLRFFAAQQSAAGGEPQAGPASPSAEKRAAVAATAALDAVAKRKAPMRK